MIKEFQPFTLNQEYLTFVNVYSNDKLNRQYFKRVRHREL